MNLSRLKHRRRERSLTQKAVADQLGIASMTVSRWERGTAVPQKRFWLKLQEIVGIPIAEIITDQSEQEEETHTEQV